MLIQNKVTNKPKGSLRNAAVSLRVVSQKEALLIESGYSEDKRVLKVK
jgi:hypothetical protein